MQQATLLAAERWSGAVWLLWHMCVACWLDSHASGCAKQQQQQHMLLRSACSTCFPRTRCYGCWPLMIITWRHLLDMQATRPFASCYTFCSFTKLSHTLRLTRCIPQSLYTQAVFVTRRGPQAASAAALCRGRMVSLPCVDL